jgi:hypothetical protein
MFSTRVQHEPSVLRRVQAAGAGGRGGGFKCLQRIGNNAAANNNLADCAHKISRAKLLTGIFAVLVGFLL